MNSTISTISTNVISIKGHYIAKSTTAKIYDNFSLKLERNPKGKHRHKHIEYWDLNAFRPDLRDDEVISPKLQKGVLVTVLYEKVKYTDKSSKIPRFIIYNHQANNDVKYFVNVR